MTESSKLLTTEEAADLIGLQPETLKTWRRKSRKAGYQIGPLWVPLEGGGEARRIRYRLADLDAWAESRRVSLKPKGRPGRPRKAQATAASAKSL